MGSIFSADMESDDININQYMPNKKSDSRKKKEFKQDNIIYNLDDSKLIAYLIGNDSECRNILVSTYITHEKSKYIVISISKNSFENSQTINTIQFAADSKLQIIDTNAFCNSSIRSIVIPENVTEINSYAFYNCKQLKHVEFHPNSKLQKIDDHSFSNTAIESISIPSNVKEINASAFESCNHLKHITIPSNSKLKKIGDNAFNGTLIESITLPSNVELNELWCCRTKYLNNVVLLPKSNSCLKYGQNEIIIGKSNKSNDIFDAFVFSKRNIKFITIPTFIKQINSYSLENALITSIFIPNNITCIKSGTFSNCRRLQKVEFQSNSQLQIIERKTFEWTSIKKISIPEQVTQIKACAFEFCKKLNYVEIPKNSKLNKIGIYAFNGSSIKSFFVPSFVNEIGTYALCSDSLQIIEFAINTFLKSIDIDAFPNNKFLIIMVPSNFKF